jgi:hypothetical protein
MALVKLCPVCNAANDPSAQRCECGGMLIGVDLAESGEPQAAVTSTDAPPSGVAATTPRRCPHADCGQLNPPEAGRCVYCDRPLEEAPPAAPVMRAAVRWPWAETLEVCGCLLIGRESPTPPALAARLEREYSNVSRRHAELSVSEGALWIVDLGSSNGTYVNETRLAPHQPVRLANGAKVRFAAHLVGQVEIRHGE